MRREVAITAALASSDRSNDRPAPAPGGYKRAVMDVDALASRVAVLSDVHGNAVALEAVLRDVAAAEPELVVVGGDLSWGPLPEETIALVEPLMERALFVRGNAERALTEHGAADGDLTPRERWLLEVHSSESLAFLGAFVESAVVDVQELGPTRFCHGSPRSDEELVTFATPESRMRALLEGVDEHVLVTAHTHLQFDRVVADIRSINPGSVGMPYGGRAGAAYWALLGPDVALRETPFDLDEAIRRYRESGDPLAEQMVEILVSPPTRDEVVAHAEALEFSG
jgi:predicted phosphodiesterase